MDTEQMANDDYDDDNAVSLAQALSVHLLPLSGTHCLAVFVFVNLLTTFRKHLKTFYFQSAFPGAP